MPNYKMVPYSQVLSTFAAMPDGLEHLEKAYPGLSKPMGYLAHVKVDPSTGAWMLRVPQDVENEIAVHNFTQGAMKQNLTDMGSNPTTAGAAGNTATSARGQQQLSKKDMQAKLKAKQKPMAVPADEPDDGKVGTVDPAAAGSQPAPAVESPGMQPDVSMGQQQVTPLMASLLPTKAGK